MSINKIKQKLIQDSIKDSGWQEKAKWRQENEDWLDLSFSIAVKMQSALSANKKADSFPSSQKELAEAMGCSAQYVNKLLRGQENLQIETICKVQRILDIKLIEVPKEVITQKVKYQPIESWTGGLNIKSTATTTSASYTSLKIVENYELAA
jgi:transcriptional regulator with XRE-family HTH domain